MHEQSEPRPCSALAADSWIPFGAGLISRSSFGIQDVRVGAGDGFRLPSRSQWMRNCPTTLTGVEEVVRYVPVRDRLLQKVEHHVGVVEIAPGVFREAVAVVLLA